MLDLHVDSAESVGIVRTELLETIAAAPRNQPKDLWVARKLDEMFGQHDWTKSFQHQQILIFDDVVPSEVLIMIHRWLRTRCANIENVILVVTHHTGMAKWWHEWCRINHEKSFVIKEIFYLHRPTKTPSVDVARLDPSIWYKSKKFYLDNKKINKVFSYYGGTYSTDERQYMLLKLLPYENLAHIDFLGQLSDKDAVLAYVENITYYTDQTAVDKIALAYDMMHSQSPLISKSPGVTAVKNEKIDFQGLQWHIDRHCFASVVRETINNDRYACVTEKSLRAFLYHCVVLPTGYLAVEGLEQYGFWFDHDLIDYSYQYIPLFHNRMNGLQREIDRLCSQSLDQLQVYYVDNLDNFLYNSNLVSKLAFGNHD